MRFEEAMGILRAGGRVRRAYWADHARGAYLLLSEEVGEVARTFWVKGDPEGLLTAWPASHFDLLAEDWEEAP